MSMEEYISYGKLRPIFVSSERSMSLKSKSGMLQMSAWPSRLWENIGVVSAMQLSYRDVELDA